MIFEQERRLIEKICTSIEKELDKKHPTLKMLIKINILAYLLKVLRIR